MKVALSSTAKVNLLRATVGSTEYQSLYVGAVKWWPSARVEKIAFKVSKIDGVSYNTFVGSATWGYYMHAVDALNDQVASATRYMELSVEGYVYQLKKAYGGAVVAGVSVDTANGTLVVSFSKGTGPTADVVSVGTVAKLKMAIPTRGLPMFTVTSSATSKKYSVPWVAGMALEVGRTTTANTESIALKAEDSFKHVDVYINGYTGGKSIAVTVTAAKTGQHPDVVVIYANDQFNDASGKLLTITTTGLSSVVKAMSISPTVPAFSKTAELTVFSTTKE